MSATSEARLGEHDVVSAYFQSEDADIILRGRPACHINLDTLRLIPNAREEIERDSCIYFRVKRTLLSSSAVLRDMLVDTDLSRPEKKPRLDPSSGDIVLPIIQLETRGPILEIFLRYLSDDVEMTPHAGSLKLHTVFGLMSAAAGYKKTVIQQLAEERLSALLPKAGVIAALAIYVEAVRLNRKELSLKAYTRVVQADYTKLPADMLAQLPSDKQMELARAYIDKLHTKMKEVEILLEEGRSEGRTTGGSLKFASSDVDAMKLLLSKGKGL